jgi:MFS family permease
MPWYLPDRNPLFWDEMRRRLRGQRSLWLLAGYGIVLCCVVLGIILMQPLGGSLSQWTGYGQKIWHLLLVGQGVLVLLIAPGMTAGIIPSARQRNTLDFLLLTALTSKQLVAGFFWGQLSLLLLMVTSSAPVIAIVSAAYGGISPLEVLVGYTGLYGLGMLGTATALLASCRGTTASAATIESYSLTVMKVALLGLCGALGLLWIYILYLVIILLFVEAFYSLWVASDRLEKLRHPVDPLQEPPWEYIRPDDDVVSTGTPTAHA